jgi:LysR family transcriptional regulator, glycine cleavage system transcriptional activator
MKASHLSAFAASAQYLPSLMALRSFERAAARLSFKLAAMDLSMTPSAVSHQVRGLERQFGVRLFARTGRSVSLTAAGDRYLVTAKAALALLENGSRALAPSHSIQREFRVSALPYFVSNVMLPRLDEFLRQFPHITLRMDATLQYADFEGSGVDLAIRMGRERTAGLHLDRLFDVRGLPVCTSAFVNGPKPIKVAADLARHTLIQSVQMPTVWQTWLARNGADGLVPAGELWFDNVHLAIEAAEHGLGVALAMYPLICARAGFGRGLLAPLPLGPKTGLSYYAVCRPEQKDERVVLAMRRWLLQITREYRVKAGSPGRSSG